MPTFDKYDRTTNPDNHMRVFTHQMMFQVVSDPIWCRVFSTSLTGEALEWFSKLPANNIDSFATLKARFSTQFAPLRPAILFFGKHPVGGWGVAEELSRSVQPYVGQDKGSQR